MADAVVRIKAIDQTKAAFASVDRNLKTLKTSAGGVFSAISRLGGAFGISFGLAGVTLGALTKSVINTADEFAKLSQRVDIGVESLSALSYAANQSGVSTDSFATAMVRLSVSIEDAKRGVQETSSAFAALDLDPNQFRNTEDALRRIADAFAASEDGTAKTTVAVKLFGRAGAELIPLLNQGAAGLDEFKKKAEELGLIIGTKLAKDSERFNDIWDDFSRSLAAVGRDIATAVLPPLTDLVQQLVEGRRVFGSWTAFFSDLRAQFSTDAVAALKSAREELERLSAAGRGTASFELRGGEERLAKLRTEVRYFERIVELQKERQRNEALAVGDVRDPIDRRLEQNTKKRIKIETDAQRQARDKAAKEAEAAAKRIEDARIAAIVAVSEQQLDAEIEALKKRTEAEKQAQDAELEAYYATIDKKKEAEKNLADEKRKIAEDAGRKRLKELDELDAKEKESLDKQKELARELGLTFSSAFEDAIVNLKSIQDILKGLFQDLLRLAVRRGVTEPLLNVFSGVLGGGGGAGFAGILKAFGFAGGGIMGPGGPIPLQRFASGGISASPSLALFGEGSKREAFVPLPDGRRIPVEQRGGGQVIVNMTVYAQDAGSFRRSERQILSGLKSRLATS